MLWIGEPRKHKWHKKKHSRCNWRCQRKVHRWCFDHLWQIRRLPINHWIFNECVGEFEFFTFLCQNERSNVYFLSQFRRLKNISEHENISKIDANSIKIYNTAEFSAKDNASYFDSMKAFQSILLKRLPTETTNRMTNLYYAVTYPNATTEEMEDAVVKYAYI